MLPCSRRSQVRVLDCPAWLDLSGRLNDIPEVSPTSLNLEWKGWFLALCGRRIPPYSILESRNIAEKQGKGMKDKLPEISKEKQKLVSRVKRLAGQIDAVQRSVTDGDECADTFLLD